MDLRILAIFLAFFVLFDLVLLGYIAYKHEQVHAKVAHYFGYHTEGAILRPGAYSQVIDIPVSDFNTCKYWAYLAAQSSVDAVGYHLLMIVPVLAALLAGVFTWLVTKT